MTGPLQGWRILEVAHDVPAAFCTKILADLGADVVMAEPPTGHPLRAAAPRRAGGVSARFAHLSTGKRRVVVDGTADDEALHALVTAADVLVTDLAPARADALVGPAAGAIVVCIRPLGSDGPAADDAARHLTVFHASGEGSILPSGRGWI